jgi:hypothetical protein
LALGWCQVWSSACSKTFFSAPSPIRLTPELEPGDLPPQFQAFCEEELGRSVPPEEKQKVRFGFATGWCQGFKSRKRADAFFSVPGPMASYFHGTFDLSTSLVHSWWRTPFWPWPRGRRSYQRRSLWRRCSSTPPMGRWSASSTTCWRARSQSCPSRTPKRSLGRCGWVCTGADADTATRSLGYLQRAQALSRYF